MTSGEVKKASEEVKKEPADMQELNKVRISLVVHALAAVVAGLISPRTGSGWISAVIGFVILFATGYAVQFALKKKGMKWWLTNGLVLYLIVWFITWAFMINLA